MWLVSGRMSALVACRGLLISQLESIILEHVVAATFSASPDAELLKAIKSGYDTDEWCKCLIVAAPRMQGVSKWDRLWFISDHLVVPRVNSVRKYLY